MTAPELRALRYNYLTSLAVSRAGPYRDGLAMVVKDIEARLRCAMIQAALDGK